MYKAFKREDGRFEVYEEDEQGNNLGALQDTFGTPEEANAKIAELSGAGTGKPVDSVQEKAPEDAGAGEQSSNEDESKSGEGAPAENAGEQSGAEAGAGDAGAGSEAGSEAGAGGEGTGAGTAAGE